MQDIADSKENKTKLGQLLREKIEDALNRGYTNIYGKTIIPNEEYLKQKGKITAKII